MLHSRNFYSMLLSGGFMLLFVFYLFIYFFHIQDRSSLYLAFYALCSFVLSIILCSRLSTPPQKVVEYFTIVNVFSICALQFYLLDKIGIRHASANQGTALAGLVSCGSFRVPGNYIRPH